MSLFLAVDQSTSATKALLFDADGRVVDRESREHRQSYPQPGWVEHFAEEIWDNTLATLGALLARHAGRHAEIASLSLTNQRETVVIFDRATGAPLAPAIVWQCRRGEEFCAAHRAAGAEPLIRRKTGLSLDPYFSASKLQWLVRHRPDLRDRLADGSAVVGTVDAYLVHRLTRGEVFATDTTNASRTLLFDLRTRRWDDELCRLFEVPRRALPEIRDCTARFGTTTLGGLLAKPLPICGVMGDSQASLFAQRCHTPGSAKVTFGTGSSLLLNLGAEPRITDNGVLTALAWSHAGVPTFAFEGIIISSASTLTWLRDQLGLADDVTGIEALAVRTPDNGGVHLVPAFTGLGLPHWRPKARAAITGLSPHSDRGHIARAAFESIAFQIADALDALRAEARTPVGSLCADGGPTSSAFLMQLTADITRTELRVARRPDASALGAMLAGQLGQGFHRSLGDLAAVPQEEIIYRPVLPPERASALRAGWNSAVRSVLTP